MTCDFSCGKIMGVLPTIACFYESLFSIFDQYLFYLTDQDITSPHEIHNSCHRSFTSYAV